MFLISKILVQQIMLKPEENGLPFKLNLNNTKLLGSCLHIWILEIIREKKLAIDPQDDETQMKKGRKTVDKPPTDVVSKLVYSPKEMNFLFTNYKAWCDEQKDRLSIWLANLG